MTDSFKPRIRFHTYRPPSEGQWGANCMGMDGIRTRRFFASRSKARQGQLADVLGYGLYLEKGSDVGTRTVVTKEVLAS